MFEPVQGYSLYMSLLSFCVHGVNLAFPLAFDAMEDIPLEETRRPTEHLNPSTGMPLRTLSPATQVFMYL